MAGGRTNEIELASDRAIVADYCREGLSLAEINKRCPHYSLSKIRTFRDNLFSREKFEENEGDDCEAHDSVGAVIKQNGRLNRLLAEARKAKPVDLELLLKIEARIGENIKLIRSMTEDKPAEPTIEPNADINAQISSLIAIILKAVDGCQSCKQRISAALNTYTD